VLSSRIVAAVMIGYGGCQLDTLADHDDAKIQGLG